MSQTKAQFAPAEKLRSLVDQHHSLAQQLEECKTQHAALGKELADYKKKLKPRASLEEIEKHLKFISARQLQYDILPRYIAELEQGVEDSLQPIRDEIEGVQSAIVDCGNKAIEALAGLAEKAWEAVPELLCIDYKNEHIPSGHTKPHPEKCRPWKAHCYRVPACGVVSARTRMIAELHYQHERPTGGGDNPLQKNWDTLLWAAVNEVLSIVDRWEKAGGSFFGSAWEN